MCVYVCVCVRERQIVCACVCECRYICMTHLYAWHMCLLTSRIRSIHVDLHDSADRYGTWSLPHSYLTWPMTHSYLTWLMPHSYLTWPMPRSYLTWPMTHSYLTWRMRMWHDASIRELHGICDTRQSLWLLVRHSITHAYVPWLIRMWHDSSISDLTHLYVPLVITVVRVSWLDSWCIHVSRDSFVSPMTHSYLTWRIYMWHDVEGHRFKSFMSHSAPSMCMSWKRNKSTVYLLWLNVT